AKGLKRESVEVVRDGVEIAATEARARLDKQVVSAIRGNFKFVLLHAGNLGFYGAWETLLVGARSLADEGVGLVFVGNGAEYARLRARANGQSNVRFLPFFPASKISSVLAAADAHLITVKRGLEGVVVPSKMYGILAAGKPIVAVAPRECDVVTLGKQLGFSADADPDDRRHFVDRVRQLLEDPQRVDAMGQAAAAAAPSYERSRELKKLVNLMEDAALQ